MSGCRGQSPASWEGQPDQCKERSWVSQAGLPGGGKEPKAPSPKALHTPGVGAGLPAEFLWWEDPCCEWGSAAPPRPWAPGLNSSGVRGGLLHGDPELHSVLRLGRAGPHQLDEEVGAEDPELGVAQLVQRVPARRGGKTGHVKRPEHEAPRMPQQGAQVITPTGLRSRGGSHPQVSPSLTRYGAASPIPGAVWPVDPQGRPLERTSE